jgi:PKD repeat protein
VIVVLVCAWTGVAPVAGAGVSERTSGGPIQTANGTTAVGVAWAEGSGGTSSADGQYSEHLQVVIDGGPIELGADGAISVRVRNVDTGETVTLSPAAGATTYEVTGLFVDPVPLVRGSSARIGVIGPDTTGFHDTVNATASGDSGAVRAGAFDAYELALLGPEGTVVASTEPAVHGVGVDLNVDEYNGSALAVETTPPVPTDSHVVVSQTVDGFPEPVATLEPTGTDGRLVGTVAESAFRADEPFNIDIYGAKGDPFGLRYMGVFALTIDDGDRVDGPVGTPPDGSGDDDADAIPAVVGDSPPTDSDGDGIYEDVDGNGQFTILDVVAFLEAHDTATVESNTAAFDVDGNGQVTILDVVALLDQV